MKATIGGSLGSCFASVSGENLHFEIVTPARISCNWHIKRDDKRDENGTVCDLYGPAVVASNDHGRPVGGADEPPVGGA